MNKIFTIILFLIAANLFSQVGIGTTTPDASSMLEISSTNKGLLIPRLSLAATTNTSPVASPQAGLLIYNTTTTGDVTPGFYYWDGSKWVSLKGVSAGTSTGGWALTGNSIAGGNFLGTTNNQPLNFRVNNNDVGSIKTDNSLYIGRSASSNGARSIALGFESNSSGDESTALGRGASATAARSTASGFESKAQGEESSAYGRGATANSARSTAIGFETTATADDATALGRNADASGARSTATGFNSLSSGTDAVAFGRESKATNTNTTAIGPNASASQSNSTALGNQANASAINATSLGYNSDATADNATGIGYEAQAIGISSVVVGDHSTANKLKTIAIGYSAEAVATNAIAIGDDSYANKAFSTAIGSVSDATGDYSIALGYDSYTGALNATAIGRLSDAQGENSIALGYDTYTNKTGAVAIGNNTESTGLNAIALGTGSRAPQDNSIVLGDHNNTNVRVGIGTNTPSAKLQVNGTFRYVDGNQATGKVLTSDANGNASWKAISSGGGNASSSYAEAYLSSDSTFNLERYTNINLANPSPGLSTSDINIVSNGIQPIVSGVYKITFTVTYKKNVDTGSDQIVFYLTKNTNRVNGTEIIGNLSRSYESLTITKILNLDSNQTYWLGISKTDLAPDFGPNITVKSNLTNLVVEKL